MKWFNFSYYNKCRRAKKEGDIIPKEEQRIVINWWWHVPHIPFEGISYARSKKMFQLVFCGADNLYWVFCKDYEGTYKWFFKTTNDHCQCGG